MNTETVKGLLKSQWQPKIIKEIFWIFNNYNLKISLFWVKKLLKILRGRREKRILLWPRKVQK